MASNMTFTDLDCNSIVNMEAVVTAKQMGRVFAKFRLREDDASSTSAASSMDGEFLHDIHTTGSEDDLESLSLPSSKSEASVCVCQPSFSPPQSPRLPKAIAFPNAGCAEALGAPPGTSTSATTEQTPKMKKWQVSAAAVLQDLHWQGAQEKAKQTRSEMHRGPVRPLHPVPQLAHHVRDKEKMVVAPTTFVPPPGLPHPPNLHLEDSTFKYTVSSFRRNVLDILRDLKLHKNVGAAVRQLRMYNVPQHRQTAEFADMLTLAVEEERGPARRLSIAFIAGLTRVFKRDCCVAGVCLFFTEIYANLRAEIHNLKSITESEILPTLKSVMRAPEMKTITPVVRRAMSGMV